MPRFKIVSNEFSGADSSGEVKELRCQAQELKAAVAGHALGRQGIRYPVSEMLEFRTVSLIIGLVGGAASANTSKES